MALEPPLPIAQEPPREKTPPREKREGKDPIEGQEEEARRTPSQTKNQQMHEDDGDNQEQNNNFKGEENDSMRAKVSYIEATGRGGRIWSYDNGQEGNFDEDLPLTGKKKRDNNTIH